MKRGWSACGGAWGLEVEQPSPGMRERGTEQGCAGLEGVGWS